MSWFDSVSSRAREKFTEAEEEAHKAVSKVEKEAGAAISKAKEAAASVVHLAEAPEPSQATLDQMASDAADFAKNAMANAKQAAHAAKEEIAPIVDAGMQFNSGVDEAKFDTIKGIVVGAGDRIVKTYGELKAHPEHLMAGPTNGIATASAVVDLKEVRARAAAQGDSAWGWFDAVNRQWNPGVGVA
ncbi:MAG: hypothetical protein FWD73_04435, partial [Polyangiaceae bacterium]|nr:hypothetical protein [Polyangiaceae bacterium]